MNKGFSADAAAELLSGNATNAFFYSCFLLAYADGALSEIEMDRIKSFASTFGLDDAQLETAHDWARTYLVSSLAKELKNQTLVREIAAHLGMSTAQIDAALLEKTKMGIVTRLYNLWRGFLSVFVGNLEEKHPEIAYENAINGMTEKYTKLKSAAAGLIKHRTKLEARIKKAESETQDLTAQVEMAVARGEDEVALLLIEKQEAVQTELDTAKADLVQAAKDAESAKASLNAIRGEIDKLKNERDRVVAQIKDAEARKQIQEQLDGLSVDDDVKALDNVREYADRVRAEVKIGDELQEDSLEGKLSEIRAATTTSRAQAKLAAP